MIVPRRRIHNSLTRAYMFLWVVVGIAVLMAGIVSASLSAAPGPLAALSFAGGSILLVFCMALAARIMIAIQRAHQAPRGESDQLPRPDDQQ